MLGRLSLSMSIIKIDLLSNIQKVGRRQGMRAVGRWAASGPEEETQGLAGGRTVGRSKRRLGRLAGQTDRQGGGETQAGRQADCLGQAGVPVGQPTT